MIFKTLFEKSFVAQTKEVLQNIIHQSKSLLLDAPKPNVFQLKGDTQAAISQEEKEAAFKHSLEYLKRKELHVPQFGSRYGKPVAERPFSELLFTMGPKESVHSSVFMRDAMNRVVCFNLKTVGVAQFLQDREKTPHNFSLSLVDPWSFLPIPIEVVRQRYKDDPQFNAFMDAIGKDARK
jgi:hypothetical protein